MTLEEIRQCFREGRFRVTVHAYVEAAKDGIEPDDLLHVALCGVAVERREEDCRLVLSAQIPVGYPVHIVVEYGHDSHVWIVTAYIPDPDIWVMPTASRRRLRR